MDVTLNDILSDDFKDIINGTLITLRDKFSEVSTGEMMLGVDEFISSLQLFKENVLTPENAKKIKELERMNS